MSETRWATNFNIFRIQREYNNVELDELVRYELGTGNQRSKRKGEGALCPPAETVLGTI